MCKVRKKISLNPNRLFGVTFDKKEGYVRMPVSIASTVSKSVSSLCRNTAGGRFRFCSDASEIVLHIKYGTIQHMWHMPLSGSTSFSLQNEDDNTFVSTFSLSALKKSKYQIMRAKLPKGEHNYILWFPLYNNVKEVTIFLPRGSVLKDGKKYRAELPIVYYGSSITQGGCASRADNCYQAYISKWNNIDFRNLGFSGSCKGEKEMVDYLSSIKMSLFVCDYDHNAPNADFLRKTHYSLYERFRAVQSDTPILFISRPDCDSDPSSDERREVIFDTYRRAKSQGDTHVYFLDGKELFGQKDRENCFVDGTHPNDLGFYRMAEVIYRKMMEIDKKFE